MSKRKQITVFLIFILLFQVITYSSIYADDYPTIIVNQNGANPVEAMFKDGEPLYPGGPSRIGILRIQNNYGERITVNKLGMNVRLTKGEIELDQAIDSNAKAFMQNVHIKVEYKNPITKLLLGTIYEGNFDEFKNGASTDIRINKNNSIDFVYTVWMDGEAQRDVSGVTAHIDFSIGVVGLDSKDDDSDAHYIDEDKLQKNEVKITESAHDCTETLITKGIVNGYPDGSMRPNDFITREETAVLIAKALKLEPKFALFTGYTDKLPSWSRGYIVAVTNKKIFFGDEKRRFNASKFMSREEMAIVLMRAFDKKLLKNEELSYIDKQKISSWAKESVLIADQHAIITAYIDGTYKPQNYITRSEAFTMICKLLGYHK